MSFSITSIGHFFAIAVHDLKTGLTFLVAHESTVETAVSVASLIDPALAPLATTIERAGEALLGDALATVSALDAATAAKGANLTLDAQTITDLKQLLADIQKVKPAAAAVPAGLPLTSASIQPAPAAG
jgi:signal transduction histidine kinase